ncbi:MAG: heme lyase CcmF/NrfE family subunit [Pseudomonadota bacterium]
MIAELGTLALILALCLALAQGVLPLLGAGLANRRWMAVARPAALGQGLFISIAFGCLLASFAANDFSVRYVVAHSNTALPLHFRLAASWGGHEGSMLLWIEILALWGVALALAGRHLPAPTAARVLGVMGLLGVGFLCFLLFASNPFERALPAAADGQDLNPLLQDLGMIVHPPLLYMGYVGFSVAFSFATAALLAGETDGTWARLARPWTLVAWAFLTLGIMLGSFWAYYELGWGGWWFWDAVENASFMPWLVGTALIHSLAVTEKRGAVKSWSVLLAILAFTLSLLGTFLVRSGVLTSVHAFATDPRRGLFILVFLSLVVGAALLLYAWRAPRLGPGTRFAVFSRESALLLNNVLLAAAAATVLLGTLYPLLLDAFGQGKISVGPPYFESVFVPLMLPLLVLMAVGPFIGWKEGSAGRLWRDLRWIGGATVCLTVVGAIAFRFSPMVALGLGVALWILGATLWHPLALLRACAAGAAHKPWWRRVGQFPRSYWGMLAAHAGIGVFVVGVTLVKGLETSRDLRMQVGDSTSIGGYGFRLVDIKRVAGPNYHATEAHFEVSRDGVVVGRMVPEKRVFTVQNMPMTEAAIDRGFTRDLYLSLGEQLDRSTWFVRVQHKPFVGWIWSGCLLIALGGMLAAFDRRYRRRAAVKSPARAAGQLAAAGV